MCYGNKHGPNYKPDYKLPPSPHKKGSGNHDHDVNATRRWAEKSDWLRLEVINVDKGGADDDEGTVEFIATYKEKGLVRPHHEISNFKKVGGVWYFVDGQLVMPKTETRAQAKIGRNEPCPCGSGKKYKKCCGR